jgi:glycosyltransferase involved in cell wall biosynthesis
MLLLDLTHTSHTPARTGIQRVSRALHQHLSGIARPVTRDPFLGAWRELETWERVGLQTSRGGSGQFRWPQRVKWRGRIQRALGKASKRQLSGATGLIEPEFFSSHVAGDFDHLFAQIRGPRVAVFHDALPLRLPELIPPATVARYPSYLKDLLRFDGIAANSEDSRAALVSYWQWLGLTDTPPVVAIPLGVDLPTQSSATPVPQPGSVPVVLTVGTLEGRKNHLALLNACDALWKQGLSFELHLIGHFDPITGQSAHDRIRALQAEGRPVRYDGSVADEALNAAYAGCAFTVVPSIAEGFGLPVIESLVRGKPCICSGQGALGEIAHGGGCVPLTEVNSPALAGAIGHLLRKPAAVSALGLAAARRSFTSWGQYATEITDWLRTLSRRN